MTGLNKMKKTYKWNAKAQRVEEKEITSIFCDPLSVATFDPMACAVGWKMIEKEKREDFYLRMRFVNPMSFAVIYSVGS